MYNQVGSKCAVPSTGGDAYSQAVSMAGANAVEVECTIFNLGGATSLSITVQQSNDLQNWSNVGSSTTAVLGFTRLSQSSIAGQYVRLLYRVVGTGTIIMAAGINTCLM